MVSLKATIYYTINHKVKQINKQNDHTVLIFYNIVISLSKTLCSPFVGRESYQVGSSSNHIFYLFLYQKITSTTVPNTLLFPG